MSATVQLELSSVKRAWIDDAAPKVRGFAMVRQSFTSDDLHSVLPEPEHGNWFGALFAKLKNDGSIERIGYRASTRPEANGRVVAVWKRKEQ